MATSNQNRTQPSRVSPGAQPHKETTSNSQKASQSDRSSTDRDMKNPTDHKSSSASSKQTWKEDDRDDDL